ncbi:MAG: hypothetical protein ABSC95_22510 [Acetobacteraceae bacterium]|jgi:hypothetical protein
MARSVTTTSSRGLLRLDGPAAPPPCAVRATDRDGPHPAFAPDDAATAALRAMLQRLALRPAA